MGISKRVPAIFARMSATGALLVVAWSAQAGCTGSGHTTLPPMPPAEVYDPPPQFDGDWTGEVDELQGLLEIRALGHGVYRGLYRGASAPVEYILKLEQTMHADDGAPTDAASPTNRMTFTWQDGRGGRGTGWLMINRDDSALTGAFGEGAGHHGGRWTFQRAD